MQNHARSGSLNFKNNRIRASKKKISFQQFIYRMPSFHKTKQGKAVELLFLSINFLNNKYLSAYKEGEK
ncbi:hypothetical protein [Oceanobacillus profundus]|uniref:hypothetical protein n=1 Tax=Oceanobacillus TaxID=182709 RepID=UPI000BA5D70A|nr:hypothetical protein [Oceanobacillus profundus]MDO6451548.1 hypothetical protein [Oceanobacillus profundus]PAE30361.1 hypothetical protein CHI07_04795 [Paenibacillus sp. 7884-2]